MNNTAQSSITLHLNSKGKYYWDIQVSFNEDSEKLVGRLSDLDFRLKGAFPNNSTVTVKGKHGFVEVDPFTEGDDD